VKTSMPGIIAASKARVLVVDDNDSLRYTVSRSLREAGYEVLEARNGAEALARASEMPDLITLDVNLPDISGIEVCGQLKSNAGTAHIPILQLSASFVDAESRVRGLQGGADAYLTEPVNRAELVATVGALLRMKSAERLAKVQAQEAEQARQQLADLNSTLEKRVKQRTNELEAANRSLRELSQSLLAMKDTEHKRIARELHDGVGQLLAAIAMNLAVISSEGDKLTERARNAVSDNVSMVDEIVRNIRTISHLLHPPLLDEAGLASALAWYVDEFGQRSGIKVSFECSPAIGRLSSDMEIAIFRIVQESLGNVLRHSQSPTAFVGLDVGDRGITLRIRDEGVGIAVERQQELQTGNRAGVGLRGMGERVSQLGGTLEVSSDPQGTEIAVVLPRPRRETRATDAVA
jgi:signal transduction histidine kinase